MNLLKLEFTPLEFETKYLMNLANFGKIRIYSVGVWNEREKKAYIQDFQIRIYSVGVWNQETGAPIAISPLH